MPVFVADLLVAPGLENVQLIAGPPDAAALTTTIVVEQPAELKAAPAGAVCVLTRAASDLEGYQLDMSLRSAAAADVAALAVYGMNDTPRSAQVIAGRGSIALLAVPPHIDPGSLCVAVQRVIEGDAALWLARLDGLRHRLGQADPAASLEDLAAIASTLLETPATFVVPSENVDGLASDTVVSAGRPLHQVQIAGAWGGLAAALLASAATRRGEAARRLEEMPIRSRAGVLAELLLGSSADSAIVAEQARALGMPVDGWHVATQIAISDEAARGVPDAVARHTLREEVFHLAVRSARTLGPGSWNGAQLHTAVVLVSTQRNDPGLRATAETIRVLQHVTDRLAARWPDVAFAAGVGGPHEGIEGLRASAAEAAAAAQIARSGERRSTVVGFDAVGLQRMLLAWSASDPARRAVDDLLAPLDRLGGPKTDVAVRTLAAYLAERGSLVRAGERLHLHRNAVAYRIRRIAELLDADLNDSDDRFALELACRARLILGAVSPEL